MMRVFKAAKYQGNALCLQVQNDEKVTQWLNGCLFRVPI
jgi:hypothetical protein